MEEERNILPPLPTPDEVAVEQDSYDPIADELDKYWLDPTKDYPEPHYFFEYQGVGFSPLGGIQAISGQKKNGKTFVLAQLMAAALGFRKDNVKQYLCGLKARESTIEWLGHDPVVLYCDTEMEQLNTAKVLRRVHWLCELPMNQRDDHFFVLWLREVPKTDKSTQNMERWRLIKNAIKKVKPDIVFIDGLRDLVNDFNSNTESSEIVGEMMSIASKNNCCIWNVLHMNPRPMNDDESKMRGHLGTELGNKVSDTFVSIKKKDEATGEVTFTVKQQDARGKDVNDWKFIVTDDVGGLGIPKILGMSGMTAADMKRMKDQEDADEYFRMFLWPSYGATYTELEKWLRRKNVTSNRRIKELFDIALESGIIFKDDRKKYHYKGINKPLPNDKIDDIPFTESDEEPPF